MGGQLGECRLHPGNFFGQRAVQRSQPQRSPLPPAGRNNIHHGLGLGQAHAAVFKGAACKFPRPGRGCARRDQRFHQALCHGAAAMHRKLHHILARVAVGGSEKQRHGFVHAAARLEKVAEHGRVALCLLHFFAGVHRHKHLLRNVIGRRPRKAHHGNAALARGRGNGANGCGKIVHKQAPFFDALAEFR